MKEMRYKITEGRTVSSAGGARMQVYFLKNLWGT